MPVVEPLWRYITCNWLHNDFIEYDFSNKNALRIQFYCEIHFKLN